MIITFGLVPVEGVFNLRAQILFNLSAMSSLDRICVKDSV